MRKIVHLSINIELMLKIFHKREINFCSNDDGVEMTDKEARQYLKECVAKGWKVLPASSLCVGFDYFGGGCPGHEVVGDVNTLGL